MKKILIVLNIICLIAALIWLMKEGSWEPLITTIGLIGGLITLLYSNSEGVNNIKMTQKGGKNSTNYQSARDINIK